MSVEFSQLKKYAENIKKLSNDMPLLIKQLAHSEGERIVGLIKDITPVDTGLLRISWHSIIQSPSLGVNKIIINNNVKYAPYVENGHRIVNKKGATVGWYNGRFMMKKSVDFYRDKLMKIRIQRFIKNKVNQYLR